MSLGGIISVPQIRLREGNSSAICALNPQADSWFQCIGSFSANIEHFINVVREKCTLQWKTRHHLEHILPGYLTMLRWDPFIAFGLFYNSANVGN